MRDKKKDKEIIEFYKKHKEMREKNLIPPIPLTPEQTEAVCNMLISGNEEDINWLKDLIVNRVSPGVDPSAKVKAEFLENITNGSVSAGNINKKEAIRILGTMLGGYNVIPLINALKVDDLAEDAFKALREVILIYDDFNTIKEFSSSNKFAKKVLESWADGEWFLNKPEMPEEIKVKIYKVDGEINTDDLSPAGNAFSR
ncbi:MAG: aconitate hydratase B, partial [Candidatus Aminicenantes bacterium]|nr:aconitate hydratase B [Candidatus Aminicenantes bacterium]